MRFSSRLALPTLLCLAMASGPLSAAEVLLDACWEISGWRFHNGGEFPGATGGLTAAVPEALALTWNFSGGGTYVMVSHEGPFPPSVTSFSAAVTSDVACHLGWRLSDRSGRTVQAPGLDLAAGESRTIRIDRAGPWKEAWGGVDGAALGQDLSGVALLVARTAGGPANGVLRIQRLTADSSDPVVYPVALPAVDLDLAGWRLHGQWAAQWGRPLFAGSIERHGGDDGELAITLPQLGRDWQLRLDLNGDRRDLRCALPLANGGNPHALYRVTAAVTTATRAAQQSLDLVGARSGEASLGQARRSVDLPAGAFGTCMHLSYGRNGAFGGWKDTDALLELVAASGVTWIRDGVNVQTDAAGTRHIDPYDLAWLTKAKALGLKPIIVLGMDANQQPEVFAATAAEVASQLGEFATVFELGNEPNNFGGWIKTFGGTWNGKEADNSTSAWVKAHLASTNAAAEAIRKVRPDATILALGAVAPTNFRAIDLGLSPAINGVIDHPYAGCMPAERVPFSIGLVTRDGVAVGDDLGSFAGLVHSYQDKLASAGAAAKLQRQLWITEFGWPTHIYNGKNEKEHAAAFSEHAQAAYLVRRWLLGLGLGVPASCQYDFLDDYGSAPDHDEANFGLLRADRSRKPSFRATQHLTSLFNGQQPDPSAHLEISDKLPNSSKRGVLVKDWDGAAFTADNGIQAWAFHDPKQNDVRTLALWSAQPVSGEFSPRHATVRVTGWQDLRGAPLAIDLLTGICYDVPYTRDGDTLVLQVSLGDAPLAVRLFRD